MEKEDLPLFAELINKPEFIGEYNPLRQTSKTEIEKDYEKRSFEQTEFFIEKKDGSKIGYMWHFTHPAVKLLEIGGFLIPSERGKGYTTEAIQLMVDYLFLSKDIVRVQAETHVENIASQKVLEKNGFKREGLLRKAMLAWGKWADVYLYSILREEWKEPKILTKTTSQNKH
jgi:RimJ/RimL family protein N-acetyltransferase